MHKFFFFLIIYFFNLFQDSAYAYLDPGTGSSIVQIIIGIIASIGATLSMFWNKLKILIKKFFNSFKKNKNKN